MANLADYGPNPNAGIDVNADHGWGGHQYPAGVPDELLGMTGYRNKFGDTVRVRVRRELVPLFERAFAIADAVGYRIYIRDPGGSGEPWGPWSYENRAIANSGGRPSNHSKGKAIDVNAPRNPFVAGLVTDLPPRLVRAWEMIGLSWGGRYTGGKQDTMHFEYAYPPASVTGHVKLADVILRDLGAGQLGPGDPGPATPTPEPEKDWFDMATKEELAEVIRANQRAYAFDLIADPTTTAVYKVNVATGVFEHLDPLNLGWLQMAGIAPPVVRDLDPSLVNYVRVQCLQAAAALAALDPNLDEAAAWKEAERKVGPLYVPPPPPPPATHTVAAGVENGTVNGIAKKYGITPEQLRAWNNLDPSKDGDLRLGTILKVSQP